MENAREYLMLAAALALLASFYLGMRLLAMKFNQPVFRMIGFRLAVFGSLVVLTVRAPKVHITSMQNR